MIKVKISTPWEDSEFSTKRLIDQFKTCEEDTDGLEFVYDDSYDVIFYFNHINSEIKNNTRAYIFHHEPTFSGNHQTSFVGYTTPITIFGVDKDVYTPNESVIELPAHTFYGGRGRWIDYESDWNYQKSLEYNSLVKTKNISSIVTNSSYSDSPKSLYNDRKNLIQNLIPRAPFVDFYGGWVSGYENEKISGHKIDAVKEYRFNLAIENEHINNWITEKFYDSVITNTIPIYFGCKNIKEIYPEDGYVLLDSITDVDYVLETLQYLNDNAEQIYNEKLPALLKIKTRYFEEYNLLKKIRQLTLEIK